MIGVGVETEFIFFCELLCKSEFYLRVKIQKFRFSGGSTSIARERRPTWGVDGSVARALVGRMLGAGKATSSLVSILVI
jgi:hypothetical protein